MMPSDEPMKFSEIERLMRLKKNEKIFERYEILEIFIDLLIAAQKNNMDFDCYAITSQLIAWKVNYIDVVRGSPINYYFYMDNLVFSRLSKVMSEVLTTKNLYINKEDNFEQRQVKSKLKFFSDFFTVSHNMVARKFDKFERLLHKNNNLMIRYIRCEIDFENLNCLFLQENTHIPLII